MPLGRIQNGCIDVAIPKGLGLFVCQVQIEEIVATVRDLMSHPVEIIGLLLSRQETDHNC